MSFGGGFGNSGGGFSGFGSTNNNNTNTTSAGSLFGGTNATAGGFGGFGSNNNTTTNNSPFGANKFGSGAATGSGSLFGGGASNTGGFGGSGGFGSNTNNATPGATLSTGFGGSSNTTSLFGGANKTTGGFGSNNNSTGLFGSNNNATTGGFGASNTNTTNPFGTSNNNSTSLFGASNTANNNTSGFGSNNTAGGFGSFNNAASTNSGTANTPFTATSEKDGAAGGTSAYQSITMQQPYQSKSFDELRLEDYAQNRRLPQSGSFGASNTLGSFGSNNNTNTGFGASNTGFGASNTNTTNSLFGAKPATGGLFGSATSGASNSGFGATSNNTGSIFGGGNNTNNTTGGFGSGTGFGASNTNNTTGGLFGSANNQNKTGFGGGFGASNNTATTNTGFGNFGNNNNTTQSGGLFGASNNNTNTGGFGSNTGGLFGSNTAAKPATGGLFGSNTNTSNNTGGLFGGNNAQPNSNPFGAANTGGGLFGATNTNNNTNTGGLFGAKPATGGGLFGSNTNTNTNTGGLFGNANNNNNNATGGSLFGASQPAAGGSLFGNNAAKPAGTSLFGGNNAGGSSLFGGNNNATGGGLFGSNNQQSANNSLFGNSQPANNANSLFGNSQAQPNQLTASLTGDPYGNAQLFASLASPSPPVGPLATPLNGAKPLPKARASLLASVRGNSPMLGGNSTPRGGRGGYGFSYSNYNSPTSTTPVLTPGASSLLRPTGSIGSALGGRLSKSFSTSNLRNEGDGQSLVRTPIPGQRSLLLGSGSVGSGNVRRLKIDRSLRTDLFGSTPKQSVEPPKDADKEKENELRKKVSFDQSAEKEAFTTSAKPTANNALVVREEDEGTQTPEMSQINGNSALTTVHEEGDKTVSPQPAPRNEDDGEYYTEPSLKNIKSMSRAQLSNIKTFTVGREGVGKIEFGRTGPVDLSTVPLDEICGKIVLLKPRSATVYENDADKPAVGRGLNVPATIYLEQSWPRSARSSNAGATPRKSSQKEIDRHATRLKRVEGTTFVDYNDTTGVWTFTVEHFTTYELDDDETTMVDTTEGTEAPNTHESFNTEDSLDNGEQDDTFQFQLEKRSHQGSLNLPGGFEDSMANLEEDYDNHSADDMQDDIFVAGAQDNADMSDPFIEQAQSGAVQAPSPGTIQRYNDSEMDVEDTGIEEQEIPGSFHEDGLKSILKQSVYEDAQSEHLADLPWEDQLQRTLSPKKRDRQALRDMQLALGQKQDAGLLKRSLLTRSQLGQSHLASKKGSKNDDSNQSQAFKTSMDIMKSLWANDKQTGKAASTFGEARQPSRQLQHSTSDLDGPDADFHNSFKPTFTTGKALVFASDSKHVSSSQTKDLLRPIIGSNTIRFADVEQTSADNIILLQDLLQTSDFSSIEMPDMEIDDEDEDLPPMPEVSTWAGVPLAKIAASITGTSPAQQHEKAVWQLASTLFDPLEICAPESTKGMTEDIIAEYEPMIRKDLFIQTWSKMLSQTVSDQLRNAKTAEHKALIYLTTGNAARASEVLFEANNRKLAILISQLPSNENSRDIMENQIKVWCDRHDWSEFSDGQRALYSILAGQTCLVQGVNGAKEDKAAPFCLSEHFDLDWKQSLALKVLYSAAESLPQGVEMYVSDLAQGEKTKPTPWHGQGDGEDTLLSILKVTTDDLDPEELYDPSVVSGNAFDSRLAWQLATHLSAKGLARLTDDKMDALTIDYACQQERAGHFLHAIWTLLHLNDLEAQYVAVKTVLDRQKFIPGPSTSGERGDFEVLVEDYHIPASLVWSAKATQAKSLHNDALQQAQYLLYAASPEYTIEAHQILCREVGPTAIIEQQYDSLHKLLQQFEEAGTYAIEDWQSGGQIYADFCQFINMSPREQRGRDGEILLRKLDSALEKQNSLGYLSAVLEVKVAHLEIKKMVDEKMKQLDDVERWSGKIKQRVVVQDRGNKLLEKYMLALGQVN